MAALPRRLTWPKLVLASGSPRRRQLLTAVGADFIVAVPRISENIGGADDPVLSARRLARDKAVWVSRECRLSADRRFIVAADTLVVYRRHVLGKPADPAEAVRMLTLLSGRWHTVVTGVCLLDRTRGRIRMAAELTRVKFRRLPRRFIERYVASGEPLDKAGAYGIQELGALLVERIDGCYFNVVGLPLVRLSRLLEQSGGCL